MTANPALVRRAQPWLGTFVDIQAAGREAGPAVAAAFEAVAAVHSLMSFHDAASDVSRLNKAAAGAVVDVDARTWEVLDCALRLSRQTDGAFDVAIGHVLRRQGYLPGGGAGTDAGTDGGAYGDYRDLALMPGNRVRLSRRVCIDLGGIAKGYAVDCAVAALRGFDVTDGLVNAGGDLRAFGAPQPVRVRHPARPALAVALPDLDNLAAATSSGYYTQDLDGRGGVDPLVDPRGQTCLNWADSVTVVAPDAMRADALTKVVKLKGRECEPLLLALGAQALIIEAGEESAGSARIVLYGKELLRWT